MARVIRVPLKVTTRVRTGSFTVRCRCGRLIRPNTSHTCTR
jgi:hypothetical protein